MTFITFEGIDGSGKSTQARMLSQRLFDEGYSSVLTREPGGCPGAEDIRRLLVEGEPDRWSPYVDILLFTAARVDHIDKVIRPAIEKGTVVVCDRFLDSTLAYQGLRQSGVEEFVLDLHNEVTNSMYPDITFLLDMNPDQALTRANKANGKEDRYEKMGLEFQHRLRDAYKDLVDLFPRRFCLISADNRPGEIHEEIWSHVHDKLALRA